MKRVSSHPKHYHFSAICGTAMASLAVLLKNRGHKITGSDENIYPPMSDFLKDNQIAVSKPYRAENLQPHPDYVVLGNSLSRGNPEVEYALENHLHYLSMAELLKNEFIRGNRSIVVSGTHGKTTTTSIAAHVFTVCGKATGFLVGGIPENFGTSSCDVEKGGYFVIEGDEYDTSLFDKRSKFFHYLPDRLILSNIEFDHADIFDSIDDIKKSFRLMLRQIPQNGLIIVNGDDSDAMEVAKSGYTPLISFGTGTHCDAVISNISAKSGQLGMTFDLDYQNQKHHLSIPMIGEYNVRNATSVILLALNENLEIADIQSALSTFKNVKRRLQLLTQNRSIKVFDDFAHHPTAIYETLKAVRQAWPESKIHALFEPRSNTSVRNIHQDRMANSFSDADTVIFAGLYRKEKIALGDRLNLDRIIDELNGQHKNAINIEDIEKIVPYCLQLAQPGDIFITMSNGAFGGIQHQLAVKLDEKW